MTVQGIVVLDAIALLLMLWILNQVRSERLYVGYAVIFLLPTVGVVILLSTPPLLTRVTHLVGALFPTSALTLLALCFVVFLLVYVLTQVTLIAQRLAVVVQELAILRARQRGMAGQRGTDADV
ncbi:MAG: DUF2304 domain-containing protein [Acidobacteriota bacterium]